MPSKTRNVRHKNKKGGQRTLKGSPVASSHAKAKEAATERLFEQALSIVSDRLGFAPSDFRNETRSVRGAVSHITFDCPASSSMLDIHLVHENEGVGLAIYTTPLEGLTHVGFMVMPIGFLMNMRTMQNTLANSADLEIIGDLVEIVRVA